MKTLAAVATLILLAPATPAAAQDDPPPENPDISVEQQLADALVEQPGGTIVGNRLEYPDGSGIVAFESDVMSLGQCSSGWFCTWREPNFEGTFSYRSGTGTRTLSGRVRSLSNNRSGVAHLYNNAGTSSRCYEDGAVQASIGANYRRSPKVNLSSSTNC